MNEKFDILTYKGVVKGFHKETEQQIHGSGGGGWMYDGYGSISPINISTSTSIKSIFFLVSDNEDEHEVIFYNSVNLRDEQKVKLYALLNKKNNKFLWLKLFNYNTKKNVKLLNRNDLVHLGLAEHKKSVGAFYILMFILFGFAGLWATSHFIVGQRYMPSKSFYFATIYFIIFGGGFIIFCLNGIIRYRNNKRKDKRFRKLVNDINIKVRNK